MLAAGPGFSSSCISNHNIIRHRGARPGAGGVNHRRRRHEILVGNLTGAERPNHERTTEVLPMAKRGRKKRDRKYSKANHGKRPNA